MKKSKILLVGREKKRALVLLEAKWFVKEWEPEGKAGQLVLMHTVKGTLAENRTMRCSSCSGVSRSHLLEHSAPMSGLADDNESERSANVNKHLALYCSHTCVCSLYCIFNYPETLLLSCLMSQTVKKQHNTQSFLQIHCHMHFSWAWVETKATDFLPFSNTIL